MADIQTLRQAALARTPFSTWLGVVLLFFLFGVIAWAVIGPSRRTTDYEQKRAADRIAKLKALRDQDNQALTGYAWVDKNKGTVRIPIERAMELAMADLAQKKPASAGPIATPAPQPPAAAAGVAAPPSAPAPAGSPAPSLTPKGASAPGTPPGAASSPAASSAPAANPPVSPAPMSAATPHAVLPVRGASPSPSPGQ
jgi:hypothetical protein